MDRWETETLFFEGDPFFESLFEGFETARISIDMEMYIFDDDALGRRVIDALIAAHRRGVEVRLVVDGIGSMGFSHYFGRTLDEAGVPYKIYHRLPWDGWFSRGVSRSRQESILTGMQFLNRRNHRKVAIVDGERAWVGSLNVTAKHCAQYSGAAAWRDSGVMVTGDAISLLERSFELIWGSRAKRLAQRLKAAKSKGVHETDLLRLNFHRHQRRWAYRDLRRRLRKARTRIWITSSYFVPNGRLLQDLYQAAARGIDVRVIAPEKSDVPFMPWVGWWLYDGLIRHGVKVFEYKCRMLHAKTLQIDDWAVVGSSNLNFRSFLHDLEADVVITHPENRILMARQFEADIASSAAVTEEMQRRRPWWLRACGAVMLAFRYFI